MSTKEEPPSLPKLITLNKGLKLAEQWVKNMLGELDDAEEVVIEIRPLGLGLGAKVPQKSQVGPINDPVGRRLHKKLGIGRKKFHRGEDSEPSKNEMQIDDEDDDDNLESRANAFDKKRAAPLTTPQAKKKQK